MAPQTYVLAATPKQKPLSQCSYTVSHLGNKANLHLTILLPFTAAPCLLLIYISSRPFRNKWIWDQLLRGRLGRCWSPTYHSLVWGKLQEHVPTNPWAKTVIQRICHYYSTSHWKFHNGVVHGHSIEDTKQKEFAILHKQVQEAYYTYHLDPYVVSPQFSYVFTQKKRCQSASPQIRTPSHAGYALCWRLRSTNSPSESHSQKLQNFSDGVPSATNAQVFPLKS